MRAGQHDLVLVDVHIPCEKPGYTFSVEFFTSLADSIADAPIGTI